MRELWDIKIMSEVYDVRDGTHDSPKYQDEGYPLITSKNLKDGIITFDKIKYISEEDYISINKRSKVDIGDVLFAMIGTIGNPTVIQEEPRYAIKNVALFKVNRSQNSEFLKYYLESPFVIDKMMNDAKGSTQRFVGLGYLRKFPIPIPPLPEQQQIVALLDQAFEAIDQAKANIEKNIENAKELFQSKLTDIFSQKGEGWEEKTLGEVCLKTKNIKWQDHKNEEYQYVDLSSVSRETLEVTETAIVNDKNAPSRAKKIIEKGDVIFATTRPTLKRATIIDEELDGQICSTGYVVLRPNENISTDWIFFYLLTSTFMDRMESLQRGASYPAVTDSDVKGSILSVPTSKVIESKYVSLMRHLREGTNELILQYQEKLISLEELKKSILQKAFAGELTNKTVGV